MNKIDCLIIGCGPAGISCAIYLKRYGFNPVVVGTDYGALKDAHKIENYYGISSISGIDLAKNGISQAKNLGIEVIFDEVLSIEGIDEFQVICKNHTYMSKTVMIAVGAARNKLAMANKFEGLGVSYCATCDGFFYRKKKTAIIGSGDYMLHELEVLKNIIPDLTIFTNGEELKVNVGDIKVVLEKIISFDGKTHLEGITTTNHTYEIEGCFIASGKASGVSFAKHLGIELENNAIVVDKNCMTNISGIFAGGDAISGLHQVSKAVSDGAIAATSIAKYLKK